MSIELIKRFFTQICPFVFFFLLFITIIFRIFLQSLNMCCILHCSIALRFTSVFIKLQCAFAQQFFVGSSTKFNVFLSLGNKFFCWILTLQLAILFAACALFIFSFSKITKMQIISYSQLWICFSTRVGLHTPVTQIRIRQTPLNLFQIQKSAVLCVGPLGKQLCTSPFLSFVTPINQ